MKPFYVIISAKGNISVRKYLSKVSKETDIDSKTLAKHFQRTEKPYTKEGLTVNIVYDIDLKSFNKGNVGNLT